MKLVKEVDMPLLSRKRVVFEIEHLGEATPSEESVKQKIASYFKVEPSVVSIRHIYSRFGSGMSKVIAHVYKKAEDILKLEPEKREKKKKEKK